MPGTDSSTIDTAALVEEACARNRSIELHYHNRSGDFFAARTRLLACNDTHIFLDAPQSIGKKVEFKANLQVEAFLAMGSVMYSFKCKVAQTQCHLKLNDYITVDGLQITRPGGVNKSQRRHDMRIAVGNISNIPVLLHETSLENQDTAPLEANVFHGTMENLSGGGCGLGLDTTLCSKIIIGRPMFLSFEIPGTPEPFIFQVEVRSVHLVEPDKKSTRVGVQFMNWPSRGYLQRNLRPLEKLIAEIQRSNNNKRIGKG